MKPPINLRVEQEPYPHLRDDKGCILARDFQDEAKLAFILQVVREKLAADTKRPPSPVENGG